MILDLSEFLSVPDKKEHIELPFTMEKFKTKRMSVPVVDSTEIIIDLRNTGRKKFWLTMQCDVTLEFKCDRCLSEVPTQFEIRVDHEIDMSQSGAEGAEDLDELSYIEDNALNVDALIHNELLVNLPMKVLCDENCKGICNRCGVNLNQQSCDCDTKELDPRMSKILDIFNNFKEVE